MRPTPADTIEPATSSGDSAIMVPRDPRADHDHRSTDRDS